MLQKITQRIRIQGSTSVQYGHCVESCKITEQQLGQMYSIYQEYYDNTQYVLCLSDFHKKRCDFIIPSI